MFGAYIHSYKFDVAVADGVVLDLRYEARDIDQNITSQKKVYERFEATTRGPSHLAKTQLKQKWGTMKKALFSKSRLQQIVNDILLDMDTKPRLMDGMAIRCWCAPVSIRRAKPMKCSPRFARNTTHRSPTLELS